MTFTGLSGGLGEFWDAITAPAALAALRVTLGMSAVVALVNVVMGTLVAWVLVRDDFRGKSVVNALIDLPFALPTIVASIVLLSLYGPYSPIGVHLNATRAGLAVALAFVTLPFVVRAVQPVLLEADREVEEAAASLGRRQPDDLPAAGAADAAARPPQWRRAGLRPGHRRVRLGRPHRRQHPAARRRWRRSTSSSRSRSTARSTPPPSRWRCCSSPSSSSCCCGCSPDASAAARSRRREARHAGPARRRGPSRSATSPCSSCSPSSMILWRTFGDGDRRVLAVGRRRRPRSRRSTCRCSSSRSSCRLNVVFGITVALALVARPVPRSRRRCRRSSTSRSPSRRWSSASPLILLWGAGGWFGGVESLGFRVIFGLPGMVLATIFVTHAVRRARGRAGAAGDRPGAGAGGGHPRRVRVADVLAHHPAGHPLGPHLRRRPHRRAVPWRVRRGDHGVRPASRASRRR